MDARTIVPENGQAKVLKTMQLATIPTDAVSTLIPIDGAGTPAPAPAHAHADDPGVNVEELEDALEQLSVQHEDDSASLEPSNLSLASTASTSDEELGTPYPHIFVVGDAADAFGAINAGHTAYFQVCYLL